MIQFALMTPEGERFSAEVDQVLAQGVEGELGILPDHVPLITPLKVAPLHVKIHGAKRSFAVYGGLLHVTPTRVTALVERADLPEDLDRRAVQARQEALRARLDRSQDEAERAALQAELERIEVQLEVLG